MGLDIELAFTCSTQEILWADESIIIGKMLDGDEALNQCRLSLYCHLSRLNGAADLLDPKEVPQTIKFSRKRRI